jgi:hypothetical protein
MSDTLLAKGATASQAGYNIPQISEISQGQLESHMDQMKQKPPKATK